jgi:thioredoxin reductase (NADPH)
VWTDPATEEPAYLVDALIVATGAKSLMLGLPEEARLLGHGVSTCATCDGFFFRDLPIAVVGGGDSALEEALFLSRFGSSVTLIHRRAELRASRIMQDRAFANPKIAWRWNTTVTGIIGDDRVESVRLHDSVTGTDSELAVRGLFVAIGHHPNTEVFASQLQTRENGYITTFAGTATSVDGVFACGDVQDDVYRQAITSAGSGCAAAIDAERWLEAHGE